MARRSAMKAIFQGFDGCGGFSTRSYRHFAISQVIEAVNKQVAIKRYNMVFEGCCTKIHGILVWIRYRGAITSRVERNDYDMYRKIANSDTTRIEVLSAQLPSLTRILNNRGHAFDRQSRLVFIYALFVDM